MSEQRVANDVTKYVHFEVRVPSESQPTLVGKPTAWEVDGYFRRHEDAIERNVTKVFLAKCRHTGFTGPAGEIYYDSETHTLYDKEYYFTHIKKVEF